MQAGGAERVMAQLCNHLAAKHHDVTLVTLTPTLGGPFYDLAEPVRLLPIEHPTANKELGRIIRVFGRIMALRRALATLRPDVVISFVDLTNVMVLLATAGLKLPVIVSERIDPGAYTHRLSRIDRALRYLTYPRASWIVVQTKRAARFFDTRQNSKIVTIPNPVPATDLAAQPDRPSPEGRFRIICVGRLDHQKGFDILIESFLRVAHEFPIWDVVIFGEGSDRSALLTQIQAYGLENRVKLMGISRDVASEMVRAHIIAFPSRYEGFPNALAEAMAVGLPAIAFNGVSGVEDLIIDDETGLLIDWDQSKPESPIPPFVDGLRKLMTEAELRMRLGAGGKIRVQQYSPEIILKQWQQLITEAGAIENS
jgi:glycosyltransferase involved in cell wall biosynthesis